MAVDGGIINDIVKLAGHFKDKVWQPDVNLDTLRRRIKGEGRSISRLAKKSIMHFPLIISDSCDFEMASALATAIEYRSAVLVKMVIERIGIINLETGESKEGLISKISGFDMLRDELEGWENVPELRSLLDGDGVFDLSEEIGNGLNCTDIDGNILIVEAAPLTYADIEKMIGIPSTPGGKAARLPKGETAETVLRREVLKMEASYSRATTPAKKVNLERDIDFLNTYLADRVAIEITKKNVERDEAEADAEEKAVRAEMARVKGEIGTSWANVEKKTNKAEPLKISVDVEYHTPGFIKNTKFTLGVKTVIHIVPSTEMTKFLPKAKFDMSFLIKLARLWTGETKFFKDFVFNLKEVKDSFRKEKAGKDGWYAKLKRLTSDNSMRRMIGGDVMSTATLAVSMEDVEEMLRETDGKFDLSKSSTAKGVVESLSLLNLVIIDEVNDRIWWYDEADSDFDVKSIDGIKKEDRELTQGDLLKTILAVTK